MSTLHSQATWGADLRLMRLASRLTMRDVARYYGASAQRIYAIEAAVRPVPEPTAQRYHRAVKSARAAR